MHQLPYLTNKPRISETLFTIIIGTKYLCEPYFATITQRECKFFIFGIEFRGIVTVGKIQKLLLLEPVF